MGKRLTSYPTGVQTKAAVLELQTAEPTSMIFSEGVAYTTRIKSGGTYGSLWLESDGIHYNVAGSEVIVPSVAADSVPSMDNAYNAGHTITVDAGAIALTDNSAGTANTFSIAKTGAGSGNLIDLDLDAGVGDMALYVDAGGGARTAELLKVKLDGTFSATTGGTVLNLDISQTGASASPAFDIDISTVYTGNLFDINFSGAGTGAIFNIVADKNISGKVIYIDCGAETRTADVFEIKFDGAGNVSALELTCTNTGSGDIIDINVDAIHTGNALGITYGTAAATGDAIKVVMGTNVGGAAMYITGAGARTDSIFEIADASTGNVPLINIVTTGIYTGNILTLACNTAAATGNIIDIDTDTNLAGNALYIDCGAKTRTASTIKVKADGAGNTATIDLDVTNTGSGDVIDIDITGNHTGNGLDITYATGLATGDAIQIDMGTNVSGAALYIDAAGARTDSLIEIADASTGNTNLIQVTTTGAYTGNIMRLQCNTGAATGNIIDIDTDTNLAGNALYIDCGAKTRTGDIMKIKFDGAGNVSALEIDATNTGSGDIIDIDVDAIHTGNAISVTYGTASATGDALAITMGTAVGGSALVITGTGIRTDDLIKIDDDSTGNSQIFDINLSGAYTGNIIDIATGATTIGSTVLNIALGSGARTVPVIAISDTGTTSANTKHTIDIDYSGIVTGNCLDITYGTAAATGNAIDINMGTNVAGDAINIASAGTGDGCVLDIAHSGNLADGSAAVKISSTGSPAAADGNIVEIIQSTGAGTTGNNALYISATGANVEAIKVDDGAVVFDETLTVTGNVTCSTGLICTAVAKTATVDGTGTGTIPAGAHTIDVTSSVNTKIILLPVPVLGQVLYLIENSNTGYELKPQANTQYINGTLCDVAKSLAIPANQTAWCICTVGGANGKWVVNLLDDDGTIDAGGTPD